MKLYRQIKTLFIILILLITIANITIQVNAETPNIRIIQGALHINENPDTYMITKGIDIHMNISNTTNPIEKTISTKQYASGINFGTGFVNIDKGAIITFSILMNETIPPEKIRINSINLTQDYINITTEEVYTVDLFITIENNPPNPPENQSPENNETDIDLTPTLKWTCTDPENDTITYTIYLGKKQIHTGQDIISTNQSKNTITTDRLDYNTWYYWKIIATDQHNNQEESMTWRFKTIQNTPPNKPTNPTPANNQQNRPKNQQLKWTCTDPHQDTLTYDVYFGTNQTLTSNDKQTTDQNSTTYNPGIILSYNTTYYWKIKVQDQDGLTNTSPTWSFTISETNLGPKTPSNPTPKNNTNKIPISTSLTWAGEDSDGDTVTYDIYFGTQENPPLIKQDHSSTTYTPSSLQRDTIYFWKIKTTDAHGLENISPTWTFTTISDGTPKAHAGGPYTGSPNENIQFDASQSTDDNTITGYRWDFTNDGTYDTEWLTQPTTTHQYPTAFTGKVKLQVKDDEDNFATNTANIVIEIQNNKPTITLLEGPSTAYIDQTYTINITATDDEDTTLTITINWGDQTPETTLAATSGQQISTSHTYTTSNVYSITANVKDSQQTISEESSKLIVVKEQEATKNTANKDDDAGFPWLYIIIIIVIIVIVIIIFLLYKRNKLGFIKIVNTKENTQETTDYQQSFFSRNKENQNELPQPISNEPFEQQNPTPLSASQQEIDEKQTNLKNTDLNESIDIDKDKKTDDVEFKRL